MEKLLNKIWNEDCLVTMKKIPNNFIDIVICSPPYDSIRNYEGYSFNFENTAKELYRIMKPGGVIVWVVGDSVINGGESLTSFKQALYFQFLGFLMHDTMIYEKNGTSFPARRDGNRYSQIFEYVFILVKPQIIKPNILRTDSRFSKEDAAWLAAAIDGEGCFRISPHRKEAKGCFRANIMVGNNSKEFISKCFEITNMGNVYCYPNGKFNEWQVGSNNASKIAAEIYPYLIIKKEQAKVLMKFQTILKNKHQTGKGSKLTKKEKEERTNLYNMMKSLNQQEINDSGIPEPDLKITICGKPKTAKLICDKENRWAGFKSFGKLTMRTKKGELIEREMKPVPQFSSRNNIWRYNTGKGYTTKDEIAFLHPAIMPEELVKDHLLSWSNEFDICYDPFGGVGTTAKMCILNNRNWIMSEISEEYCQIAEKRINQYKNILINNVGKVNIKKL